MKKRILFMLFISFCFMMPAKALYTDANVGSYEQELAKFPCDYQAKIKNLHNIYPNAIFVAQKEFFDWNKYKEVPVKWNDMLAAETTGQKSLIGSGASASYKTGTCAQWSGSKCSWYVASKTGVEYYLNPYNFLDERYVFMFESQLYNPNQNVTGVENILSGSFMSNRNCPGSNKNYSGVLMEAGQTHSLSSYMLASRVRQEQGNNKGPMVSGNYSGYQGLYNYFNIGATGGSDDAVIKSGLAYAKEQGWNTEYKSIIGGAKFLRTKYIGANDKYNVKGQMTDYLQKWDPYGPKYGGQQYMQNIVAPYSEASKTYNAYAKFSGYKNNNYVFYIPIFEGAPNTTNNSCNVVPNSYKTNGDTMSGINPGSTVEQVKKDTNSTITDANGKAKTSGKLATGDKITKDGKTYTVVIYGDISGDGEINSADLLKIRQQLIGTVKLSSSYYSAADTNKDSKVDSADLLKVRQHLIGSNKITQ